MKTLTKYWKQYRELKWYWQVLLVVPLILGVVLYVVMSAGPKDESDLVEHHKKHVDKQIKDLKEADKVLVKQDKKLAEKQEQLQQEIKDNETQVSGIVGRINNAVSNNDADELKRIKDELNRISSIRKDGTPSS